MKKTIILTTLILLFPLIASAMTLEEYVANLDTSFYNGTINVTTFSDRMIDTNGNSLNDTLIFNFTTDYATADTYTAELIFIDESIPIISDTRAISSGSPSFYLNISTYYLTESTYTYFVRIYNEIGLMIYESKKQNTSIYTNFESGTSVTSISDSNIGNNLIRMTLNLDVIKNETVNVTVNLGYNDSIISGTKEVTLTTPTQEVSIDIDNETIKSTHYIGTYNISSIIMGNKIIEKEYTTSSYDYETFAKTEYIKEYQDGLVDTDQNNLSEFLEINFTLDIMTAGTYNLESELRDEEGNYIALINETEYLSTGTQIIQARIDGSEIYRTYSNGPYIISYAKLSAGSTQKDITYNPYTTNDRYYAEFERSLLPDLKISIGRTYDDQNNVSTAEVNITNIGDVPAFNIFLDIFDNNTYENESLISSLNDSDKITFTYNIQNSSNDTIITAITDFSNIIDESDESNNVVQYAPVQVVSLTIESITTLYSNGTHKIFEFVILNDGDSEVTDIFWTFDTGDNYIINSTTNITSLAPNERSFVFLEYNYSSDGTFDINVNATGIAASAIKSSSVSIGNYLSIESLDVLYEEGSEKIFEFIIKNNGLTTFSNINWSLDTGEEIIYAEELINLTANQTTMVFAQYQYQTYGNFSVIATATSDSSQASKTINVSVTNETAQASDVKVTSLSLLYSDSTHKIFGATIQNQGDSNISNINWTFNTGEGTIYAKELTSLTVNESQFVYIEYNYSQTGDYEATFTVTNATNSHSMSLYVDAEDIEAYDLQILNQSSSKIIIGFNIKNYLNTNLTNVEWSFDTKDNNVINSLYNATLEPDEEMFVFLEYNYSQAGTYNINVTAINGTLSDSENLTVII